MKRKSIIGILLACTMLAGLALPVGCTEKKPDAPALTAPLDAAVDADGVISWSPVSNAVRYEVVIDGQKYVTTETTIEGPSGRDFTYSVKAIAGEGYSDSEATTGSYKVDVSGVTVKINAASELKSGASMQLKAVVEGTLNTAVEWSVVSGGSFVSVSANGSVTAKEFTGGTKQAVIKATSVANPEKSATKQITVVSRTQLNQSMLDALNTDYISFTGMLDINLYTFGLFTKYYSTYQHDVATAMNGERWYAEYTNGNTGLAEKMYCIDKDGVANKISVSYLNDEKYEPLTDEKTGAPTEWTASGLYNNFKNLKVSDFTFNETSWKWEYTGTDSKITEKMVASANPYDFKVDANEPLSLIIDDGEIIGFYAKSAEDYTIAQNYMAIQELRAFITGYGENIVEVPVIGRFEHRAEHDKLQEAISNMKELERYSLNYREMTGTVYTQGYTESGFVETITPDKCYFRPYNVESGSEVFQENGEYGYCKIEDNLYNTIFRNSDASGYTASRAYASGIENAKPSFDFAPEIFKYVTENEDGSTTYMVDENMTQVGSYLYYGVGNDIALYGLCGTIGYINSNGATMAFTPYVVVKDGYIRSACFYYNLSYYMYGYVFLEYSDFDTADFENEDDFYPDEVRQVPKSWSEFAFTVSTTSATTEDDVTQQADAYWQEIFGDEANDVPFFGAALGDTFGFGLSTYSLHGGSVALKTMQLYYDVPLDRDYTLNTSLNSLKALLSESGFTTNSRGEYVKGSIHVELSDSGLDLVIYVWKSNAS